MKSQYKYVRHDPEGRVGGPARPRTKARMNKWTKQPWVATPQIDKQFEGNRSSVRSSQRFATEREAALFVDRWMLEHGKQPVNILKAKV